MTGFHGLHVLGGLVLMVVVAGVVAGRSQAPVGPTVEVTAYYWHFVDVVWVGAVRHDLPAPVSRRLAPVLVTRRRVAALVPTVDRQRATSQPDVDRGAEPVRRAAASSCHGADGEGVARPGRRRSTDVGRGGSPTSTSRPGACRWRTPTSSRVRKRPAYDDDEIDALVAYVASLGDGPAIPSVDPGARRPRRGRRALPGELPAPCHSAAGAGGALSYGRAAPDAAPGRRRSRSPRPSAPGRARCRCSARRRHRRARSSTSSCATSQYLDDPDDRGGLPLGRIGPIPEGFVAWVVGIGALLAARRRVDRHPDVGTSGAQR